MVSDGKDKTIGSGCDEPQEQVRSLLVSAAVMHALLYGQSEGSQGHVPPWALESFAQLDAILKAEEPLFPCLFARKAHARRWQWFCFVDTVTDEHDRARVLGGLLDYFALLEQSARTESQIVLMPLIIMAKPLRPQPLLQDYHHQAWELLQYLHDHDPAPWPAHTPTDPDDPRWSFCFKGVHLFANISCPAHSVRLSRRLGDSLTLVMQPRANFDVVAGNDASGRHVRRRIRQQLEIYENGPVPDDLGYYGTEDNREWTQMAVHEQGVEYPARCPLRIRRGPTSS